jgi:hypothetical protein
MMDKAMVMFTVGFLMTFGGVGGIENSMDNMELALGVVVSGVGLLVMWVGTELMKSKVWR